MATITAVEIMALIWIILPISMKKPRLPRSGLMVVIWSSARIYLIMQLWTTKYGGSLNGYHKIAG